jgi:hypothetical protein
MSLLFLHFTKDHLNRSVEITRMSLVWKLQASHVPVVNITETPFQEMFASMVERVVP